MCYAFTPLFALCCSFQSFPSVSFPTIPIVFSICSSFCLIASPSLFHFLPCPSSCWLLYPPLFVFSHLFRGAGHEKRREEHLKWSVAFRLYIGSFPCAQLPGPVHTARLGRVFFCLFSLGLCSVCSFVFFLFVCMSPFVCFPEQLSHLPYSFWR